MIRLSQKKLLSRLFQEKKSISNSKFKFPLLNNGYNKDVLGYSICAAKDRCQLFPTAPQVGDVYRPRPYAGTT